MKTCSQMIKDYWLRRQYNKYVCLRPIHDVVTDSFVAAKGDTFYIKKASGVLPLGMKADKYIFTVRTNNGEVFEMLAVDLVGKLRPVK